MTYLFSSNTVISNEVEVKNDVGNALPVVGVEGSPITVSFAGSTIDSFGRLRTSTPHTIFDNVFFNDEKSKVWDTLIVGAGSSTYQQDLACVNMGVSNASGTKVTRQTKQYFHYQPGKSLLTMLTFVLNEGKANLRQRAGYFDNQNGIYLEREGNVAYMVKRSYVTGSTVETRIPQSSWNEDKLDGTGNSRININLDKAQIFFTDIEWLGVGSVRTGFIIDGVYHFAHTFHHANIESNVYMTTATLPIRLEIENTGVTTGSSNLKQICSTVISEAGYAPASISRSAATALAGLDMSQNDFRPIVAIRLKAGETNHVTIPTGLDLYGLQTTPYVYKLVGNANIIGGTWTTTGTDSVVEYNANATTLGVGGYDLFQGMFVGGTSAQPIHVSLKDHNHSLQLRANITGAAEAFAVVVKSTTNNDKALGSLTWEEHG